MARYRTYLRYELGAHPFGLIGQVFTRLVTGKGEWATPKQLGAAAVWGATRIGPFFIGQPWIGVAFIANDILLQPPIRLISAAVKAANVALSIPTLQNFFHGDWLMPLMNSPKFSQTLKNIIAGSRRGMFESTANAVPFAIGDLKDVGFGTASVRVIAQTSQWVSSLIASPVLRIGWDIYRIRRVLANRQQTPLPFQRYIVNENIDNWGTTGTEFLIFPRAILNATPRTNTVMWAVSRIALLFTPLKPVALFFWSHDVQRMADEGFLHYFTHVNDGKAQWWINPSEWRRNIPQVVSEFVYNFITNFRTNHPSIVSFWNAVTSRNLLNRILNPTVNHGWVEATWWEYHGLSSCPSSCGCLLALGYLLAEFRLLE